MIGDVFTPYKALALTGWRMWRLPTWLRHTMNFGSTELENANPIVYDIRAPTLRGPSYSDSPDSWWKCDGLRPNSTLFTDAQEEWEEQEEGEPIDAREVFDLVRSVTDPEHPLTLEQLAVVNEEHITVDTGNETTSPSVVLEFTPTIPHCSMATLIGLSLRVRLLRALPTHYKLGVLIRPGTHQSAGTINKQLSDKERVAAAVENKYLMGVIQGCLSTAGLRGIPA